LLEAIGATTGPSPGKGMTASQTKVGNWQDNVTKDLSADADNCQSRTIDAPDADASEDILPALDKVCFNACRRVALWPQLIFFKTI
jgi:hypothetical protein